MTFSTFRTRHPGRSIDRRGLSRSTSDRAGSTAKPHDPGRGPHLSSVACREAETIRQHLLDRDHNIILRSVFCDKDFDGENGSLQLRADLDGP